MNEFNGPLVTRTTVTLSYCKKSIGQTRVSRVTSHATLFSLSLSVEYTAFSASVAELYIYIGRAAGQHNKGGLDQEPATESGG